MFPALELVPITHPPPGGPVGVDLPPLGIDIVQGPRDSTLPNRDRHSLGCWYDSLDIVGFVVFNAVVPSESV